MTIPVQLQEILVADVGILSGAVRFKGTRVPLKALLDTIICDETEDYLLDDFSDVSRAQAMSLVNWGTQP